MNNIIQWNCNGCKSHLPELQILIAEHTPFAICIQESHLKCTDDFVLRGYKTYRLDDRVVHRAKGGVCTLVRDTFSVRPLNVLSRLQVIAVEIIEPFHLILCNIYLPYPNWSTNDLLRLQQQLPRPFIILGDFNSHNTIWGSFKTTSTGRSVEDFTDRTDSIILNNGGPTHFNSSNGNTSAIDLTICSPEIAYDYHWNALTDLYGSDHYPIIISNSIITHHREYPVKWKLARADWDMYRKHLDNIQIPNDIDEATGIVTEAITRAASQSIPKSQSQFRRNTVPWWNNDVRTAIANKRRALKKFNTNPTRDNLITFKKFRSTARRCIREAKKSSWSDFVSEINPSTPISRIWCKIRALENKKSSTTISLLKSNGVIHTDGKIISEMVADTFETTSKTENFGRIFQSVKADLEKPLDFSEQRGSDAPYNAPFTYHEFECALNTMKNRCPGPDGIPAKLLQELPTETKSIILRLYNMIWLAGKYPDRWRESIIVPVLKHGRSMFEAQSYRPISLTCCLSKVLEKMINSRLIWLLETKNILSNAQNGFRKHRSCTDNLVELEDAILSSFVKHEHLIAIFFDIEKAYDMTWRYGILKNLHDCGVRGNMMRFISDFMNNRTFRVRVGKNISSLRPMENGVPQGSVLSVTLFLVAINDIVSGINHPVKASLYADDLVLYSSAEHITTAQEHLQQSVDTVCDFAKNRGFKFNILKTKSIQFYKGRESQCVSPKFYIDGQLISVVSNVKYLGVTFDQKLSWKPHIEALRTDCKRRLNILRCLAHISWGADRDTLLMLYKTLIQPRIDFGSIVYSSARTTVIRRLDPIIHEGIRLCTGAFKTSPRMSLLCEAGIYNLYYRRSRLILNYAAKVWTLPFHPNYDLIRFQNEENHFCQRQSAAKPLKIRVNALIQNTNIKIDNVFINQPKIPPPWQIKKITVHYELTLYDKVNTNPNLIKTILLDIINSCEEPACIYTDGSKMNSKVGCAIHDGIITKKWRLQDSASIFTAELYAILMALEHIQSTYNKQKHTTFLILTDSLSAVQAIQHPLMENALVERIVQTIIIIEQFHQVVEFIWIPSHIGIEGNHIVDKAAKEATEMQQNNAIPILYSDIRVTISKYITSTWQQEWSVSEEKLNEVKPTVDKWETKMKLKRRDSVVITRLRIGHTRLTHGYLIAKCNQPVCQECKVMLTVKHILAECKKYDAIRFLLDIGNNIKIILSNNRRNIKKLLKFCALSKIYDEI